MAQSVKPGGQTDRTRRARVTRRIEELRAVVADKQRRGRDAGLEARQLAAYEWAITNVDTAVKPEAPAAHVEALRERARELRSRIADPARTAGSVAYDRAELSSLGWLLGEIAPGLPF